MLARGFYESQLLSVLPVTAWMTFAVFAMSVGAGSVCQGCRSRSKRLLGLIVVLVVVGLAMAVPQVALEYEATASHQYSDIALATRIHQALAALPAFGAWLSPVFSAEEGWAINTLGLALFYVPLAAVCAYWFRSDAPRIGVSVVIGECVLLVAAVGYFAVGLMLGAPIG